MEGSESGLRPGWVVGGWRVTVGVCALPGVKRVCPVEVDDVFVSWSEPREPAVGGDQYSGAI